MLIDLSTVEGYVKNPSTCPTDGTLEYCKREIRNRYTVLNLLHMELVNKGIKLKHISPELFEEYILIAELLEIINK